MVTKTTGRHWGDKVYEHLSSVKPVRDGSMGGHHTLLRLGNRRQITTNRHRIHLTTPHGPLHDRTTTAIGTDTRTCNKATVA